MSSEDEFERIYTGSEVNVSYLQGLLEEQDIPTIVRNEFQSGLRGGFGGGSARTGATVRSQTRF